MQKDVLIHISGIQFAHDGLDNFPVEVISPGTHYIKNGYHYLLFEDVSEEEEEPIKHVLKFNDGYLEVRRSGSVCTRLIFELNKKTISLYETPFGAFSLGISATEIDLTEKEDEISLHLKYALEIDGTGMTDCRISLLVRPKGSGLELIKEEADA